MTPWIYLAGAIIQLASLIVLILTIKEVIRLAQVVTEEEVRKLLAYVRQLLATNVNNRAEIDRLKAEARDAEWTRSASLDAEIEQTLSEIGDATPGAGAGATVDTPPASQGEDSGSDGGSESTGSDGSAQETSGAAAAEPSV